MLLRALGTEEKVGLDVKTLVIEEDDQLLLCSDGLSNKVSIDDMRQILQLNEQLEGKGSVSFNWQMIAVEKIISHLFLLIMRVRQTKVGEVQRADWKTLK